MFHILPADNKKKEDLNTGIMCLQRANQKKRFNKNFMRWEELNLLLNRCTLKLFFFLNELFFVKFESKECLAWMRQIFCPRSWWMWFGVVKISGTQTKVHDLRFLRHWNRSFTNPKSITGVHESKSIRIAVSTSVRSY